MRLEGIRTLTATPSLVLLLPDALAQFSAQFFPIWQVVQAL